MDWRLSDLIYVKTVFTYIVINFSIEKRETVLFGRWTLKDILAHLLEWDRETIITIDKFLKKEALDWVESIDDFNSFSTKKWADTSFDDVFGEFNLLGMQLIDVYKSIPENLRSISLFPNSKETLAGQVSIDVSHHLEHLAQIIEVTD